MLMSVHRRACHAAAPASNSFIDYFIQIADFISADRPLVGPYVVQNHSASGRRCGGEEAGEAQSRVTGTCHALVGLYVYSPPLSASFSWITYLQKKENIIIIVRKSDHVY